MAETPLQIIQSLKLVLIAVFALLYGLGGISGKWRRRFVAPALYASGLVGFGIWTDAFHWQYLLCWPFLSIALHIGYGAIFTKDKIIKRSRYGLACGLASLSVFWLQGAWTLLALHTVLCIAVSTIAGVWNQTSSARAEETLIGASLILVPMYTI